MLVEFRRSFAEMINSPEQVPGVERFRTTEDFAARVAITALFVCFAIYTWGHWGNVQIDCGREVYVPVELLKGRLLYRDVWYPYGPLVPYLQAILVRCFGAHLETFYCLGLLLNLSITYLVYDLARRLLQPMAASVVAIVCLRQGFSDFVFNYVFPYSYAAVIGLLLALLCLYFICRYIDMRLERYLVRAGLATGLALLCKQEFGAAALLAVVFVMTWDFAASHSLKGLCRQAARVAPGLLLAMLAYGWFFWRLTPEFMLKESFALGPDSPFMKTVGAQWIARAGFRFVPSEMFERFASVVFSLGVWFLGARLFRNVVKRHWILPVSLIILTVALICGALPYRWAQLSVDWAYAVTFPIGMYWVAPIILIATFMAWPRGADRATYCTIALMAVFAMALASRVMFKVVRGEYSVYYDLPLFIVFMTAVTGVVRFASEDLIETERLRLINWLMAMDVVCVLLVPFPWHSYQTSRTIPLETSIGTIFTQPEEAALIPEIISFVRTQVAMGKRVLILPDFPMLYVMGGTESPSRWYELVPGLLSKKDEDGFIAAAELQHVEYVIVTNRATFEYGYPYFGIDWGQNIYHWINTRFEQSGEFGKFERRRDAPFAALIYRRNKSARAINDG